MKKFLLLFLVFSLNNLFVYPSEKAKETAKPKETAMPKAGEGINSFLLNNGRSPSLYYNDFIALNKNKFGKNNSLLKGVAYTLPPISSTASLSSSTATNSTSRGPVPNKKNTFFEPIFGKKYGEYTVQSNKLAGATFYLVSGHGGPDCGAIGHVNGTAIHEVEYAYDIMLRLARALMMEGATVHVIIQDKQNGIRDEQFLKLNKKKTCRGKEIPRSQVKRLQQRCDEINALAAKSKDRYQRAVFIHLDSRSNKQELDVFFLYNQSSVAGKNLANTMKSTFKEQYQIVQPGRGYSGTVSSRNLYVLNNTTPVSLFAELGNIQNSRNHERFLKSSNRQVLANWMCRGLIADYQNTKK